MSVYKIHHITKYKYNKPVTESVNEIKIYPIAGPNVEILFHQVEITNTPELMQAIDYWGNRFGMFNIMGSHEELVIESKLRIRTLEADVIELDMVSTMDDLNILIANKLQLLELAQSTEHGDEEEIKAIADVIYSPGKPVSSIVKDCCEYIYTNFRYIKGITNIETTVSEILSHRSGVCQDFAHVMLEVLRYIGIPARYVSGYICPNKNGMRGEGATHAWVEVFMPNNLWAGIDPTNNVWVTNTHIRLAVGRNFSDCTPMKGTFKGNAKQSLSVYVSVGYEDGHVFEELTNVRLDGELPAPEAETEEVYVHVFGEQQQQQQQQ